MEGRDSEAVTGLRTGEDDAVGLKPSSTNPFCLDFREFETRDDVLSLELAFRFPETIYSAAAVRL